MLLWWLACPRLQIGTASGYLPVLISRGLFCLEWKTGWGDVESRFPFSF